MIKDQLTGAGRRTWDQFKAFTPGQKAVTIVAVLGLIIGGYLFTTWKAAPQYAPLYTNLAASDASAIADKLKSDNIPYQLGAGGAEIQVPTADVDKARLDVSAAGLPNSGQTGYSLLDKEGVTTSQFQQQVDYQRAVEGELAKTIQAISGIQAASVHLAIPQQDVFNDGSQKPTAAVQVTTSPAITLGQSQVQSIVYLVASSVPGLTTNNVSVIDSNGNVLAAAGSGTSSTVGADSQAKLTQDYDNRIAASLQGILDQTLGPNHAAVTVNATLDFAKTKTVTNSYLPNPNGLSTSKSTTKEAYNGSGAGAGGTLGTTGTTGGSGNGRYNKTTTVENSALSTMSKTVENAPGQVQNLHIGVMVDKSVQGLNVPAITNLVRNGLGLSTARGDSLSVQAVPFSAAAKVAKPAVAKSGLNLKSLVKQGVLGLLIAGLALGFWLSARKRKSKPAPPPGEVENGLDLFDSTPDGGAEQPTMQLSAINDLENSAARKRAAVVAAADRRPGDVANALSGWLNTKES